MKAAINILSYETGLTVAYLLDRRTKVKSSDAINAMEKYLALAMDKADVRVNFIQAEFDRASVLKSFIERKYNIDLCSSKRIGVIDYKQAFIVLSSKYTALSQQTIAEMVCLKSHASISLACKKIDEICSVNKHLVKLINEIKSGWEIALQK